MLLALAVVVAAAFASGIDDQLEPPPPPSPPVEFGSISGTAVGVGRLWNCTVCQRASVGADGCQDDSSSARTVMTGQYRLSVSQPFTPDTPPYALLLPSAECTDFMTGAGVTAPVRCGAYVCSVITDLHAELMYTINIRRSRRRRCWLDRS